MLSRANWAAILLFSALLAQAPHAAWVFLRIAPHDDAPGFSVAIALAILGAIVYAIALEGATAYFVWHNAGRIAVAFAVFSFLHNVAYYMPIEWGVNAWGAWLTVRFILSMLLISASLPIAIAAFSHVQASRATAKQPAIAVQTQAPELSQIEPELFAVQTPVQTAAKQDPATRRSAILAHLGNGWNGSHPAKGIIATIAAEFGANSSTIYRDLQALQDAGAIARDEDGTVRLAQ
jgi:hypothetical protein